MNLLSTRPFSAHLSLYAFICHPPSRHTIFFYHFTNFAHSLVELSSVFQIVFWIPEHSFVFQCVWFLSTLTKLIFSFSAVFTAAVCSTATYIIGPFSTVLDHWQWLYAVPTKYGLQQFHAVYISLAWKNLINVTNCTKAEIHDKFRHFFIHEACCVVIGIN